MPGTLLTFTINKSMQSGARSGLLISLGHALLELLLVFLLFAGAGRYLSSGLAQLLIGLAGGLALLVLAAGMLRDTIRNQLVLDQPAGSQPARSGLILGGVLLSAANPYFLIWWAVVGLGLIMAAYQQFGLWGVLLFYLGHILADISWYTFVAGLTGRAGRFISRKAYRVLVLVLAGCLAAFGISFIIRSLAQII